MSGERKRLHVVCGPPACGKSGYGRRLADWPERLAERFGTEVQVHFVWAEAEVRRERMVARGAARDLTKLADWEGYLASCAQGRPVFECVLVEST